MNDDPEFEWHHAKHGVAFDTAQKAFSDPIVVEVLDNTETRTLPFDLSEAHDQDEQDHCFTQNGCGAA